MKKQKKHPSPSDLNSKTVRLNIGDYQLLAELSRRHNVTFAEAFHQLITEIAKREAIVVPKSQIPMPAFAVSAQPTFVVRAQPTIAVNGNKAGVLVIKPKGGVICD